MMEQSPAAPLEIWAGLECTLNRVGDQRFDQFAMLGHDARTDELEHIASLGVRTLRYPILWERLHSADEAAWRVMDDRMRRMQLLGIDPIVGLVHHGSGPDGTSLLEDGFASGLATFARSVATRYPWVTRFTPVNEPLTTARFSALYGHWYPHARNDSLFLRATFNQVRATRLAMRAIREISPHALLVQTEDLGRTHATPALMYQAEFENERRWLTFDLLAGCVVAGHPMHDYARWCGFSADEIARTSTDTCVPDMLGINHYVTSERYLDEHVERYPEHVRGGNQRHRYADVEAVRALPRGIEGLAPLLVEAWKRYQIPLAVTERHLGCTREQQLRWLLEGWEAAGHARRAGADVRALTAWAAFGTYDWSSLLTRRDGEYEPGLFDVRAPHPRPTALSTMIRSFAAGTRPDHPVLASPGWWHCQERLTFSHTRFPSREQDEATGVPILIVGSGGTLGTALVHACRDRGLAHRALPRGQCDIAERPDVERALRDTKAWAVINAAGYVRVDDAERELRECHRGNVTGAVTLAAACAEYDVRLVTMSTDLVFGGHRRTPWLESDRVAPGCAYGRMKAEAEDRVLRLLPSALVVRTAAFFGVLDEWNFLTRTLRTLKQGDVVEASTDIVSPTYVPDLAHTILDLLIDGERGLIHLANAGTTSWVDFARAAAQQAGLDPLLVHDASRFQSDRDRRPAFSALASERCCIMPSLAHALTRYVAHRPWERDAMATHSDADLVSSKAC